MGIPDSLTVIHALDWCCRASTRAWIPRCVSAIARSLSHRSLQRPCLRRTFLDGQPPACAHLVILLLPLWLCAVAYPKRLKALLPMSRV